MYPVMGCVSGRSLVLMGKSYRNISSLTGSELSASESKFVHDTPLPMKFAIAARISPTEMHQDCGKDEDIERPVKQVVTP